MTEFKITVGEDVKRKEMPFICDKCFRGEHGMVCGVNLFGKACLCICRYE